MGLFRTPDEQTLAARMLGPHVVTEMTARAVERMADLDALLPSQLGRSAVESPEGKLWRAVLTDAVRVAIGWGRCGGSIYVPEEVADARAWLADDAPVVGGARWVCEHVGVDLDRLRRRVAERLRRAAA